MKAFTLLPLGLVLSLLYGCAAPQSKPIDTQATWAVLPFTQLSTDASATELIEKLLLAQLSEQGIKQLSHYPQAQSTTGQLQQAHKLQQAKQWAAQHNIDYSLSGTVHEWKVDERKRPQLALSLCLTRLMPEEQWCTDGSRSGRIEESPQSNAEALLRQLLSSFALSP